ncbi:hypothetical protein Z946_448 [Sulfitobacter noctilucicola]|nr:hypothetical protein Z946_448 [Sulfitobacter noctilucicola]
MNAHSARTHGAIIIFITACLPFLSFGFPVLSPSIRTLLGIN